MHGTVVLDCRRIAVLSPLLPASGAPARETPPPDRREPELAEKAPQEQIRELKELLIAYFRQETIDPLKGLARYVGFGLLGASLMGIGICFLAVGGLRALQTQTGTTFGGNWSWAPYGITVVALVVIAGTAISKARSPRSSR
jgi:hypothetical protein